MLLPAILGYEVRLQKEKKISTCILPAKNASKTGFTMREQRALLQNGRIVQRSLINWLKFKSTTGPGSRAISGLERSPEFQPLQHVSKLSGSQYPWDLMHTPHGIHGQSACCAPGGCLFSQSYRTSGNALWRQEMELVTASEVPTAWVSNNSKARYMNPAPLQEGEECHCTLHTAVINFIKANV